MKKSLLLIFVLIQFSKQSYSQDLYGNLGLSVASYHSYNFIPQTQATPSITTIINTASRTSILAGIIYRQDLNEKSFLHFSPQIIGRGSQNDDSDGITKTKTYYFDIPIDYGYKFIVIDDFAVWGGAGAYAGIGLLGTITTDIYNYNYSTSSGSYSQTTSKTLTWGSTNNSDIKRFDYGLRFLLGFDYQKATFSLGYQLGLANLEPTQPNMVIGEINRINNRGTFFQLSYKLK